jgi:hypothetical protein
MPTYCARTWIQSARTLGATQDLAERQPTITLHTHRHSFVNFRNAHVNSFSQISAAFFEGEFANSLISHDMLHRPKENRTLWGNRSFRLDLIWSLRSSRDFPNRKGSDVGKAVIGTENRVVASGAPQGSRSAPDKKRRPTLCGGFHSVVARPRGESTLPR